MTYKIFHIKRVDIDQDRVWASWEGNTAGQKQGPTGFGETMVEAIDDRERLEALSHTIDIF